VRPHGGNPGRRIQALYPGVVTDAVTPVETVFLGLAELGSEAAGRLAWPGLLAWPALTRRRVPDTMAAGPARPLGRERHPGERPAHGHGPVRRRGRRHAGSALWPAFRVPGFPGTGRRAGPVS